jgi:hypothetical protein
MKKFIFFLLSVTLFISCKKEPVADFEVSGSTAVGGELVFENHSSNADSYLWDFGDKETSTLSIPTHVFKKPGQYVVTLIAEGDGGSSSVRKVLNITGTTYTFLNSSGYDLPKFCSFYYDGNYIHYFVQHGMLSIGKETDIVIAHSTEIEIGILENDIVYLIPKVYLLVNGLHNELVIDDAALSGRKELGDSRLAALIRKQLRKK